MSHLDSYDYVVYPQGASNHVRTGTCSSLDVPHMDHEDSMWLLLYHSAVWQIRTAASFLALMADSHLCVCVYKRGMYSGGTLAD